jgi:two-component system response regulator AtoC
LKVFRVAVIDDEITVCKHLRRVLEKDGYEVETFQSAGPFLESARRDSFSIVFLDLMLPDANGMEILATIKGRQEDVEVVVITGHGSIDSAIEAIKRGAYHYVTKPFKLDEIRLLAKGAREKIGLRQENRRLREALDGEDVLGCFIGSGPAMQEIFAMIKKVAAVNCNVLLQGESGTGKELVARSIHRLSARKRGPFVSFNCGGFTEELICNELFGHEKGAFTGATITKIGLLESASGGTVFLDEIGEMPPSIGHSGRRREQQRHKEGLRRGFFSRRSFLPAERGDSLSPSARRKKGRYPSSGLLLHRKIQTPFWESGQRNLPTGARYPCSV